MKIASTRLGRGLFLLFALVALDLAGASFVGNANAAGLVSRVQFARGDTAATLRGAVVRGDFDIYILRGNAGQSIDVGISSIENNAVFQIKGPDGAELGGAQSGDDTRNWSGKLPRSGDYRIVVGGTRGNATYKLKVSIR
jgi:type II secretory pathway pseudopilin PulG